MYILYIYSDIQTCTFRSTATFEALNVRHLPPTPAFVPEPSCWPPPTPHPTSMM